MTSPTYGEMWPKYAREWDAMTINSNKVTTFEHIAHDLVGLKNRYLLAEQKTGVPWYFIALLHMRESDNNFNTQLAQGDPLHKVSTHVPTGRGPFDTWEDGAYDALITLKHWDRIEDWRLEKILYYAELYNGWGYYYHNVPSAYVWAGSSIYKGGKYIADGVWSSTAMDQQPGVAPVLKCMMKLDSSIKPARETPMTAEPPVPVPAPAPKPPEPPPLSPKAEVPAPAPKTEPGTTSKAVGGVGIIAAIGAIFDWLGAHPWLIGGLVAMLVITLITYLVRSHKSGA